MRVHPFEDCAVIHIIEHLRFALEVLEIRWRAELGLYFGHEGSHVAVSALVPVVVGPVIADGPLIFFRNPALKRFQRGE